MSGDDELITSYDLEQYSPDDSDYEEEEPLTFDKDGEPIRYRSDVVARLPPDLVTLEYYCGCDADWVLPEDERPQRVVPCWDEIAKRAKLDRGERRVLEFRLQGYTRDLLLRLADGDKERKEFQAAWRRLDRSWPRVKSVITGGKYISL